MRVLLQLLQPARRVALVAADAGGGAVSCGAQGGRRRGWRAALSQLVAGGTRPSSSKHTLRAPRRAAPRRLPPRRPRTEPVRRLGLKGGVPFRRIPGGLPVGRQHRLDQGLRGGCRVALGDVLQVRAARAGAAGSVQRATAGVRCAWLRAHAARAVQANVAARDPTKDLWGSFYHVTKVLRRRYSALCSIAGPTDTRHPPGEAPRSPPASWSARSFRADIRHVTRGAQPSRPWLRAAPGAARRHGARLIASWARVWACPLCGAPSNMRC